MNFEGVFCIFIPIFYCFYTKLTDIRELQKQLKEKGMTMLSKVDESTQGPAFFTIEDREGNQILVDQNR